MAKAKLTVTFNGQTFTRTTARKYSHVVVARNDREFLRAATIRAVADTMKVDWAYYVQEAGDSPKYNHTPEQIQEYRAIVARGLQGAIDHLTAERLARLDRDYTWDKFHAFAWCGRLDLAIKQADTARSWGKIDIEIVPIEQ